MNRDKFTLISKVRLIAWTSFFVVGFVFSAEKDNSFLEEISQEEIQAIVSGKKPCNLAEEIKLFQSTNAVVVSPDTLRDPEYVSIKIMNELLVFCKLSKVSFESEMNKFKKQNKEEHAILLKETFLFLYSTFIKIRTIKMMKDFNLSYAPLNLKINKMTSFIDLFIKKQHSCSTLEVVLFGKLEKIVSELLPLIDNDKLKEYFALTSPNNYLSSLYRLKDSCKLLRPGQGTQLASLLPELLDTIAYLVVNYSTVFLTEVESFCVIEKKPKKVNFSSSMIKLLQYVLLCQAYAFTNQDALEEHENALIAIYQLFYEYAEKNNLIPTITLLEDQVFKFPSQWNMPLVAVKSIDTFKDRSISELLADIGELEAQGIFVKKQPIKTKKKKKQAQDVVEKVEALVDLEESSPAAYLEVDTNIYSAHKKMPIAYNARVNDWFVDQERALTVQGYKQGEDFFKQGLLSKFGERVIVFNHRFPRIIDQIILRDVKIIPIVQDDGSYLVKIPGYYTDGNELRHFGFFEVAYSIKESSVISTKKKKNGSLATNIEIFHRFFRPVDEFSDLFSNAGNEPPHFLVENELEKYEIEAVEAVNSAWTVDEEQEGWKAQLENEENGFILINHPEKLLNYVLLI